MENSMMTSIAFENVTLNLGGKPILQSVDLSLKAPGYIAIYGPSGAGKTSLLRLAAGLLKPTQGNVRRSDELRVGLVAQQPCLLPWRTAWENIAIPLYDRGLSRRDARELALGLLRELDLDQAADLWAGALSGGMARRVSVARAIAIEPDVLLLDEPYSGLDKDALSLTRALIGRFAARREPLILHVTHEPRDLSGLVTRTLQCRNKQVLDIQTERKADDSNDHCNTNPGNDNPPLGQPEPRDHARLLAPREPWQAGAATRWD